ncbi:MAG: glycosyltransferase family A protein [Pseudomonadota bacterium]
MATHPSVSCVIPVFNGARYLGQAIESVLDQGRSTVGIIVVDDGSTDATADVARRFGHRVTYVQQQNAGAVSARNRGITQASTEFVTLLDADDLWYPEKTDIQLGRFEARPDLAICTAHMENFWTVEVAQEVQTLPDDRLKDTQPNVGSSFMARRSLFDKIGLLNVALKYCDVQEWILRAVDSGLIAETLPDVLVKRRIHDSNFSRHQQGPRDLELLTIAQARIARLRRSPT